MIKKALLLLMTLSLAASLAACGGNNNGNNGTNGGTNNGTNGGAGNGNMNNGTSQTTPDTGNAGNNQGAENNTATVNAADAEAVYKQNCLSCHGGNMEGGMGPALNQLSGKYSPEEIAQIITKGQNGMPAFEGRLDQAQISNLSSWLASMK